MASTSSSTSIYDLLDESLMEIFCHLPCKFVLRCKCVLKRWFSLISDQKFHCLYLSHQRSFLQDHAEKLDQQVLILDPYNALVIIPKLPPALTACGKAGVLLGFTCDPYFHVQGDNVFVTSERRFRVVRIPAFTDTRFAFNIEVFSSDSGKWTENVVSCPSGVSFGFYLTALGVSHNGKLYFTCARKILVYDPCNNHRVASVIDFPRDFGEAYRGCVGVSCGNLRIAEFPTPRIPNSGRVWEIQNCDDEGEGEAISRWRLVYEFCLPDIMGPTFEKLGGVQNVLLRGHSRILAFHPEDGNTVFMNFGSQILSCNLLTQSFKVSEYGGLPLGYYPVTPLLLPWWPTPIP